MKGTQVLAARIYSLQNTD